MLGHSAVHGCFAGYSSFTAALTSRHHAYLPAEAVVRAPRRIDPRGRLYRMMRAALGQPELGAVSRGAGPLVDQDDTMGGDEGTACPV